MLIIRSKTKFVSPGPLFRMILSLEYKVGWSLPSAFLPETNPFLILIIRSRERNVTIIYCFYKILLRIPVNIMTGNLHHILQKVLRIQIQV